MREQPFTVRFHLAMRRHRVQGDLELGDGANRYPPFPGLRSVMHGLIDHLFAGRAEISRYGLNLDSGEHRALVALLNLHAGAERFTPDDVLVTSGATEALSLVFRYAAQRALSAYMPLPCYMAYELSSAWHGVDVAGYYGADGRSLWLGDRSRPLAAFYNSPDAISGHVRRWESLRERASDAGARLAFECYDLIYQLSDFGSAPASSELFGTIVANADLTKAAILLSLSKDLSLPGPRVGILVSKDPALLASARNAILERSYSTSPLSTQLAVVYLALLVLASPRPPCSRLRRQAAAILTEAGLSAIGLDCDLVEAFIAHRKKMVDRFQSNFQHLARTAADLFDFDRSMLPGAGFSAFLRMRDVGNPTPSEWIERGAKLNAEQLLALNPSYALGGTPVPWAALYGREAHLRVNTSVELEVLTRQIERLRAGLPLLQGG